MVEKIKGIVKAISDKGGKYGINIDDVWYNGFGKVPCQKGDEVEVTYKINGNFKNVESVYGGSEFKKEDKFKPTSEIQQMSKLKNQTMARCCALNCAKDLAVVNKEKDPNKILEVAETYLDFLEK